MRILRGLTFNSSSELRIGLENYVRNNQLENETRIQQLLDFRDVLTSLVNKNDSGLNI